MNKEKSNTHSVKAMHMIDSNKFVYIVWFKRSRS